MTNKAMKSEGTVISLQDFRNRKLESGSRKINIAQAFTAKPNLEGVDVDLNIRLERIKISINRINQLMQELKDPTH